MPPQDNKYAVLPPLTQGKKAKNAIVVMILKKSFLVN